MATLKGVSSVFVLLMTFSVISREGYANGSGSEPGAGTINRLRGAGFLVAAYGGSAFLAYKTWWRGGFSLDNPFKFIGETEPFYTDDAWHFFAGNMIAEGHHLFFQRFFGFSSVPLAAGASFLMLTGIEMLDGLAIRRWQFSVNDEIANGAGATLFLLQHQFPLIPVRVRAGMRQWRRFPEIATAPYYLVTDYAKYASGHSERYAISKVEIIYELPAHFYAGGAISKEDGDSRKDLFGITAGYDVLAFLNQKAKGWWNTPVRVTNHMVSLSLGLTYWLSER